MVGLGSSGVGIGLSVTLLDRFTMNATRIASAMTTMTATVNAQMASSLSMARRWGVGMALVGGIGLRAMGKTHAAFRDFDWEMTTVSAVTNVARSGMQGLDDIVKTLAQRSIFNPQEIASAATRLAKAGFQLKSIEKTMEGVVMLGTATDTGVGGKGGVADMMAKIMRSFDIVPESSGRVADIITKSVNSAAMDMDDAFEALKFLGNTSHNLGLKLEDSMAMVGVLANAGVPQGIAGRGLVNALNKIATSVSQFATKGNKDALAALGLGPSDIKDAAGNMLPIVDILDKLILGAAKLGNTEKISSLAKLLRLRGSRAVLPLLAEYNKSGGKTFKEFRRMLLDDSAGEAFKIAEQRMAAAKGVFMIMGDVFDTLKVTIGEALDSTLTPFFKMLTQVMRVIIEFVKTPIGKFFTTALTGMLALLTITGLLTIAVSSIGMLFTRSGAIFAPMIQSMIWGMNQFGAATLRAVGAQSALNSVSWTGAGGTFAAKGVKGFQSGAMLMAGGAGGKIGGKGILNMLGRAFTGFVRFLGPLGMIVGILGMIIGFKPLLKGVVVVLGSFVNFIKLIFDAIIGLFTGRVFEAFDKFTDAQGKLGTTGMFADPKDAVKSTTYNSARDMDDVFKKYGLVPAGNKKNADMYSPDQSSPSMGKGLDITNNIIVDDEVVQTQSKEVFNKEFAKYLQP